MIFVSDWLIVKCIEIKLRKLCYLQLKTTFPRGKGEIGCFSVIKSQKKLENWALSISKYAKLLTYQSSYDCRYGNSYVSAKFGISYEATKKAKQVESSHDIGNYGGRISWREIQNSNQVGH